VTVERTQLSDRVGLDRFPRPFGYNGDSAATTEREPKASALDRCLRRRRFRCLRARPASSRSISPMRFARSRASSVVRSWVCVLGDAKALMLNEQLLAIVRGLSVLLACHDGSLNVAVDCRSARERRGNLLRARLRRAYRWGGAFSGKSHQGGTVAKYRCRRYKRGLAERRKLFGANGISEP
jgi:hypothetical protein